MKKYIEITCVYLYTYFCVYFACFCVCTRAHVCMCVCTHTCIHTHTKLSQFGLLHIWQPYSCGRVKQEHQLSSLQYTAAQREQLPCSNGFKPVNLILIGLLQYNLTCLRGYFVIACNSYVCTTVYQEMGKSISVPAGLGSLEPPWVLC
jgi:hypothetical protein